MQINERLNKISRIINIIIVYEMLLGGLGRLFGYPIRIFLLVLGLSIAVIIAIREKRFFDFNYLKWIIVFSCLVVYLSLWRVFVALEQRGKDLKLMSHCSNKTLSFDYQLNHHQRGNVSVSFYK